MSDRATSIEIGAEAEYAACRYLEKKGFKLLERNYRCKVGELDIVMKDREWLVFVEVRMRKSSHYGNGLESITYSKQKKLYRAALHYLQTHNLFEQSPCRFDVISATIAAGKTELDWIINAFTVEGLY